MKYIGTDYLYNLDEINYLKQYISEEGIELYLMCPFNENETLKLAVSREQLYRQYRIQHRETEYDVFEIDFNINYHIDGEEITVRDERVVEDCLFNYARSIQSLLSSFGGSIISENIENRNRIIRFLNTDRYAELIPPRDNEMERVLSFNLSFDGQYVISDTRGNNILRFNNPNNAREVFHIICEMIHRIVVSIR